MQPPIDLYSIIQSRASIPEDDVDAQQIWEALEGAEAYLKAFAWCPPIVGRYFGCGVAGVAAAHLFRFSPRVESEEEFLWVVNGDIPTAYLVCDNAPSPGAALSVYCELMEDWVKSVKAGKTLENVFPVQVEPTIEHAHMLEARINFIRKKIIPKCNRLSGQ
jgi:hypothetical protein